MGQGASSLAGAEGRQATAVQASPLDCRAEEFSIPPEQHYLNCAYMGPLPVATEEAMIEGVRRKRSPSQIVPRHFFEDAERVRGLFGALVGGSPERVAIVPSASYGVAFAAKNLPVAKGQTIVLTGEQFPGNVYSWRRVAAEVGARVVTVDAPSGEDRARRWNARLLEAIDGNTAVVSLPHVHWTDGTRFDLDAISERTRSIGAGLVIDGTQSVGALPIDVARVQPDLLVSAGYKWLLGPYSIGVAHVGPRLDGGCPPRRDVDGS